MSDPKPPTTFPPENVDDLGDEVPAGSFERLRDRLFPSTPTADEIERTRESVTREIAMWERNAENYAHSGNEEMIMERNDALRSVVKCKLYLAALDALAREPALRARVAELEEDNKRIGFFERIGLRQEKRIAELEVTEHRCAALADEWMSAEWAHHMDHSPRYFASKLRAALAGGGK